MRLRTVVTVLSICIPASASAQVRPFLGFFMGIGSVTPSDEFYKGAGLGQTSTNQGLQANQSVVRDASGHAGALAMGLDGGIEFFPLLAAEGRAKYEWSFGGGGQHYFRGNTAVLGTEDASFAYRAASVDVGPRVCLGIFCLHPFVGAQTYASYEFTFGSGGSYSSDESSLRSIVGAEALMHVAMGKNRVPAFDIGFEYEQMNSSLGGTTHMFLFTLGMDFALFKAGTGK